jgi:NAD+ synthase (glutamine-hydrolysing)
LGVEYAVKPIEQVFAALLAEMNGGGPPRLDVAEENVQARIRCNFLMFMSNRENRLLLTTGNKSELAVGYATLYGDMAGGLAVIGDVPKTMVYELCRHINTLRPQLIPEAILTKAPSAELRPDQKDTDSLPPYPLLDFVLKKFVEENCSLKEIVGLLAAEAGLPKELVGRVSPAGEEQAAAGEEGAAVQQILDLTKVVERIMRLVARAEYKRRQAPPILRVTSRHFGDGRRMPIAQRWSSQSSL